MYTAVAFLIRGSKAERIEFASWVKCLTEGVIEDWREIELRKPTDILLRDKQGNLIEWKI